MDMALLAQLLLPPLPLPPGLPSTAGGVGVIT